jgi:hypothetical protein
VCEGWHYMWKTLSWLHHFFKRGSLGTLNSFNSATLYWHARKLYLFLWFFDWNWYCFDCVIFFVLSFHYLNVWTSWLQEDLIYSTGESVDDCGGGYSESIAEMCDELQNGSLPLLIVTPNGRGESGANRDCYLLNPMLKGPQHINMFRFLGKNNYYIVCQLY